MSERPNIVFIIADQLRADFLGCYGAHFVSTPHIDSLCQGGVRYARAYSSSPLCVPARASLLTGLNAIRNGVTSNGQWLRPDLAACGVRTWPEMLNQQGYYTAAVGKMHFYPWDCTMGFQYRVAAEDKRWIHVRDDYYHFLREEGLRKLHGNEHEGYQEHRGAIVNRIPWEFSVDHFVGQEACRFVHNYADEAPFALMVSFPGPHCPYDPNEEFLERIDEQAMPPAVPLNSDNAPMLRQNNINGNKQAWNGVDYTEFSQDHKQKIRAHYAALVEQIDFEVGQVLEALAASGQLENSVIIFTSDHGDYLGDHGLIGKGTFYEASIHVPLIVHQPGRIQAQVQEGLAELGDVTATLLALAGRQVPEYMDAKPLAGLGLGGEHRKRVVGMTSGGWMLYDGGWKLCQYSTGETLLFNVEEDPQEQLNLAADGGCAEQLRSMTAELTQEIMRALAASHLDKSLDGQNGLWSSEQYGKEGWQRPYPNPMV